MIPRTLNIKGHKFQVKQVNRLGLSDDAMADCDPDKNLIRLYRRAPASRKVECVLHESMHAMLDSHGITQEEKVCGLLGEYLVQFIRDNPGFIRHALKTLSQ
jgi:hypothetical protein